MSNVSQWNTSAASNNAAPPNGAPENMLAPTVNDTMREMMAAVARWYAGMDASLVTAGSGNAYTLTTGSSHAALANIGPLIFKLNRTNTASATLNVDGLGAKTLKINNANVSAGFLVEDQVITAIYNSENDVFDILGGVSPNLGTAAAQEYLTGSFTGALTGMSGATSGTVNYIKIGNRIYLYANSAITGTSDSSAFTMTGIPVSLRPASGRRHICDALDAGSEVIASALVSSSGVVSFQKDNGSGLQSLTAWTPSGTKGVTAGWSIDYAL